MKCVKCKKNEVDELYFSDQSYEASLFVYCRLCREDNKLTYLPSSQYPKYWIAFSKKWRKENMEKEK